MTTVGEIIQSIFPNGCPVFTSTSPLEKMGFYESDEFSQVVEKVKAENEEGFDDAIYEYQSSYFNRYKLQLQEILGQRYNEIKTLPIINAPELLPWIFPPSTPVDLFAISGYLLNVSGAYHHIQSQTCDPLRNTVLSSNNRTLLISSDERHALQNEGESWRTQISPPTHPPHLVIDNWLLLMNHWDADVFHPLGSQNTPPEWWKPLYNLMVISDEACESVGQTGHKDSSSKPSWVSELVDSHIRSAMKKALGRTLSEQDHQDLYTLSDANPDIVCVLPKSRTSQVGCTIRCMSHNMAILPARGVARANWLYGQSAITESETGKPLNMLLIPYPYDVDATSFVPQAISDSSNTGTNHKSYGLFKVAPNKQLTDDRKREFIEFVSSLIQKMQSDCGSVDILVFPELSLSFELHKALIELVSTEYNDIEVIVAGLNSYEDGDAPSVVNAVEDNTEVAETIRESNFAAITVFSETKDKKWIPITAVHEKHHRWCLDRDQIVEYGLGSALNPSKLWWEDTQIFSRRVTTMAFRERATASVLICEDLARSDPAQQVLRAIGPKLIFALLMDGPQLRTRWPARYATVLADDPGSSVLTFTSMALINRSNSSGRHVPTSCVGLWRDAEGDTQELSLGNECDALCVTLSQLDVTEQTLDGRPDPNAATWILSGVQPLAAREADGQKIPRPAWVQ